MTDLAVRHPRLVVALSLLVTVVAALGALRLEVGTSAASQLTPDAPTYARYQELRQSEGEQVFTGILVEVDEPYTPATLSRIAELEAAISDEAPLPTATSSVLGFAATASPEVLADGIDTDSAAAVEALVAATPFVQGRLVAPDGAWHLIGVSPEGTESAAGALTEAESLESSRSVTEIAERFDGPGFDVHPVGGHVVNYGVTTAIISGVSAFLPLVLLVIMVTLAYLMRRPGGVVLPLLVVLQALVMTMGIGGWLGLPIDAGTQIVPPFLLAVGVADATHLLTKVYTAHDGRVPFDRVVLDVVAVVHRPVVFTSLTTAAALVSFAMARADMVRNIGILSSIGVLLALWSTLMVVPAILVLRPPAIRPVNGPTAAWLGRTVEWSARHPWTVIAAFAAATVPLAAAASTLRVSQDAKDWLPEDAATVTDHLSADRLVGGSFSYRVRLDSGEPGGALTVESQDQARRVTERIEALRYDYDGTEKSLAVLPGLETLVPGGTDTIDPQLLAATLTGMRGRGIDTGVVIDADDQVTEITALAPFVDVLTYDDIGHDIDTILDEEVGAGGEVSGYGYTFGESFTLLLDDMGRSYVVLVLAVSLLLLVPLGLRLGLLAIWPNVLPIVAGFAVLRAVGGSIDTISMLIAGILAGVAVDDTIHLGAAIRRSGVTGSLRETVGEVASGVVFSSVVLGLGFGALALSPMPAVRYFGIMGPAGVVTALAGDMLLLPALTTLFGGSQAPAPGEVGVVDPGGVVMPPALVAADRRR